MCNSFMNGCTNRRVLPNVLGNASRGADSVGHLIAVDTRAGSLLIPATCAAFESKLVGRAVLFWVKEIRAFTTEAECNLFGLLCSV